MYSTRVKCISLLSVLLIIYSAIDFYLFSWYVSFTVAVVLNRRVAAAISVTLLFLEIAIESWLVICESE